MMDRYQKNIEQYLYNTRETLNKVNWNAVDVVLELLEAVRERGGDIYICGNGGSAATASHFACDFNKLERPGNSYRFICLCDNIPLMMANANDYGYESVFVKQIEGRIAAQDVLICISGSGNSENVVRAARYAKERGAVVVGLTGYDGGEIYKLADYRLHVPIDNMQVTEDIHLMFDHMMIWTLNETYSDGGCNNA